MNPAGGLREALNTFIVPKEVFGSGGWPERSLEHYSQCQKKPLGVCTYPAGGLREALNIIHNLKEACRSVFSLGGVT